MPELYISLSDKDGRSRTWTSGEIVRGTVVLVCESEVSLSSVSLSLQGIAKSVCHVESHSCEGDGCRKCTHDVNGNRIQTSSKTVEELHRFLYKKITVFPPREVRDRVDSSVTLPRGTHEWPFKIVFPYQASCLRQDRESGKWFGTSYVLDDGYHVEGPLPPSMETDGGESSVKYSLNAVVHRTSMLRRNPKQQLYLSFVPVDPPRNLHSDSDRTLYARRKLYLEYRDKDQEPKGNSFIRGLLSAFGLQSSSLKLPITFEALFERSGTLSAAGQEIHCKLLLRIDKMSNLPEQFNYVFFNTLTGYLCSTTIIKARRSERNVEKKEKLFKFDLQAPIDLQAIMEREAGNSGTSIEIPLSTPPIHLNPGTVPTFNTCCVQRRYSLEFTGGFGLDSTGASDQYCVLSAQVDITSGIHAQGHGDDETLPAYEEVGGPSTSAIIDEDERLEAAPTYN